MKPNDYWRQWTPLFPEYKHSDKLLIVGWAPSSRDLAPYEDASFDCWSLNECLDRSDPRHTWFRRDNPSIHWQIHPVFDYMRRFNRNNPKHWAWLQQDHGFPVMMQNVNQDVPNSVAFPLKDAISAFTMYFTSSMSYEMALAILMDYKRIEIYGVEMSADSEYIYQKAGFEYLVGCARGRGIDVYLPPQCSLLRGALYAYEDLRAASRVQYGFRLKELKQQVEIAAADINQKIGRKAQLIDLLEDPEVPPESKKHLAGLAVQNDADLNTANIQYGKTIGAVKELEDMIRWHDLQSVGDDREDPPPLPEGIRPALPGWVRQ